MKKAIITFLFLSTSIMIAENKKSLVSISTGDEKTFDDNPEFTEKIKQLSGTTWDNFIPYIGSIDLPKTDISSAHYEGQESFPAFNLPDRTFQEIGSPFYWGRAKGTRIPWGSQKMKAIPFIAVAFTVKNKPFSVAFYPVEIAQFEHGVYKGLLNYILSSGGEGAHYLGKYDLKRTPVTKQDLQDLATLIVKGSVKRYRDDVGNDPELYELILDKKYE